MSLEVAGLGLAGKIGTGRSKTDARDAFIIAETARTMPHTLRAVDRDSDLLAALKVLAGFDDDLARECTRAINRLRSLLVQIYPSLERVFTGTILTRPVVLELLIRYQGPQGLKAAGKSGVKRWAKNHTRKDPSALVDQIFDALAEQSVVVPGAATVELVIPRVAAQIKELKAQRALVASEVEAMVDAHPLTQVLISMPGVGIKTAATILLNAGDFSSFPTPGHLAAYAGIAPVTRRSGTSIRGEFPARSGNKQLKNALFRSAWVASSHDPLSKAYYDRKRAEGKKHNAAVICLARRRLTSSMRWFQTAPSTKLSQKISRKPLDFKHRDTPPENLGPLIYMYEPLICRRQQGCSYNWPGQVGDVLSRCCLPRSLAFNK